MALDSKMHRECSHSKALTAPAVTNALALAVVLLCTLGVRTEARSVADQFDPSPRTADEGDAGSRSNTGFYAETNRKLA